MLNKDYSSLHLDMELSILTTTADDNHIWLRVQLCVAYSNVTTTLGALNPPVDVKIALIFLNDLET